MAVLFLKNLEYSETVCVLTPILLDTGIVICRALEKGRLIHQVVSALLGCRMHKERMVNSAPALNAPFVAQNMKGAQLSVTT